MERKTWKILCDLEKEYGCKIPSFTKPPSGSISFHTLQRICREKLMMFAMLERVSYLYTPFSDVWVQKVLINLKKDFIDTYTICTEHNHRFRHFKALHYDRISRFILYHVIVNSQLIGVKNWIITNEIYLFRLQFLNLTFYRQEEFLLKHRIIRELSIDERSNDVYNTYEVPWKYVIPLVAKRSITLKNGMGYINQSHFSVAASSFQLITVSNYLTIIKIGLNTVKLDPRMESLFNELQILVQRCIYKLNNSDWDSKIQKKINLLNFDNLSKYFPPCMERIYNKIENTHHLKHYARKQFIPFLKDIGLSLNDALQYFNNHFMQIMTEKEVKSKRYNYYIRYEYGLEGSRIQAQTKNCFKIQSYSYEGVTDYHGCPLSCIENLKTILSLPTYVNLSDNDKSYLYSLIGTTSPSKICSKILFLKHSINEFQEPINHPIQYFCLSCKQCTNSHDSSSSDDDQLYL